MITFTFKQRPLEVTHLFAIRNKRNRSMNIEQLITRYKKTYNILVVCVFGSASQQVKSSESVQPRDVDLLLIVQNQVYVVLVSNV